MAPTDIDRRTFLKTTLPAVGAAASLSLEERILLGKETVGAPGGDPSRTLPRGRIGDLDIGRVICGGNLISGFAHSRDLVYVSQLLKNYFTDEKVFRTLHLCEAHGVNTANLRCDDHVVRILNDYRKKEGGRMQWIAQVYPKPNDLYTNAVKAVDNGAAAVYVQGGIGDRFLKEGRVDLLGKFVEHWKGKGVIAGVGSHLLDVPVACEKAGIDADFYMKTLHHGRYWSRGLKTRRDNYWSETPEKTIAFMKKVEKPWIAFKVMAAGAIGPTDGFKYAFTGGADFICAGMFDFQVADDARIARGLLSRIKQRDRPWRG